MLQQHNMSMGHAAEEDHTLLTIGDDLLAQIPALVFLLPPRGTSYRMLPDQDVGGRWVVSTINPALCC